MAQKKDKMIQDFMSDKIKVGDKVLVKNGLLYKYARDPERKETVKVLEIYNDGRIKVSNTESYRDDIIVSSDQYERDLWSVGANPFPTKTWRSELRTTNYDISGIMGLLGLDCLRSDKPCDRDRKPYVHNGITVREVNDNPYIIDKDGNKQYYQRDYCWTLKDEQLFIESIYQSINCGMIVVRNRSWKYVENECNKGNTEVAFRDIVDGKQRFHCLKRFFLDEFQDMHGNYYSDLSNRAKYLFCNSQMLTLGELGENATDEDVIATFLGVNFTGVPMSQEHINYVKEIQSRM